MSPAAGTVGGPGGLPVRRFELVDGTSNKFWEIALEEASFTVRFGRIGTSGQVQQKTFGSAEEARARIA